VRRTLAKLFRLPGGIGQVVGGSVDVAHYALPGTNELAQNVVDALGDKTAALLSNHGDVACGPSLKEALLIAELVEKAAHIHVIAHQLGGARRLSDEDVQLMRRFYVENIGDHSEGKDVHYEKLLLQSGRYLNPAGDIIEGDIGVEKGRILFCGKSPNDWQAEEIIDCTHKLITPGLVNAHTHAAMTLFRSYADDMALMDWLQKKSGRPKPT